jgi:hypothetical protein
MVVVLINRRTDRPTGSRHQPETATITQHGTTSERASERWNTNSVRARSMRNRGADENMNFLRRCRLIRLTGRSPALRACLRGGLSDFVAGQCMLCALWCRLVSLS